MSKPYIDAIVPSDPRSIFAKSRLRTYETARALQAAGWYVADDVVGDVPNGLIDVVLRVLS
jgi:hypothetical protein